MIFSVFSLNAFAVLVVIDVLLNSLTLLTAVRWRCGGCASSGPDIPRSKIPGGWVGLFIATILPAAIIIAGHLQPDPR